MIAASSGSATARPNSSTVPPGVGVSTRVPASVAALDVRVSVGVVTVVGVSVRVSEAVGVAGSPSVVGGRVVVGATVGGVVVRVRVAVSPASASSSAL
jgi:hypothetical protein